MCISMEIQDIIKINKKYGGNLTNKNNLDFDLDRANKEENIYKSNAYLIRGIVAGHSFSDGCKRTAIEVIVKRFAEKGISCNENKVVRGMVEIAKGVNDINKIERRLRKWCQTKLKKV